MTTHFVNLLDELRRRSLRMAAQVEDMVQEACEAIFDPRQDLAQRVIARDRDVDLAEVEVEAEVIRLLALYQPVGIDLRMLCTILKVNNDLERIADCAVNIAERAKHGELPLAARLMSDLKRLCPVVRRALRDAIQAYADNDSQRAERVRQQDEAIDALYGQIVRAMVASADRSSEPERQRDSPTEQTLAASLDLLSVAKNLERIADHATNIAEDVIYLSTGQIVRHQFSG